MKHGANFKRIDLVFGRYFERSFKEGIRSRRGEGSQYLLEGDSTELPFKMAESFLSNSKNKDKLNEYLAGKLLELHQGNSQKHCPSLTNLLSGVGPKFTRSTM